jgi:hypothetical protein
VARGVRYAKTRATLNLQLPPSAKARALTISRANGEGFETVGAPIAVPNGQNTLTQTVEIEPNTALSFSVR